MAAAQALTFQAAVAGRPLQRPRSAVQPRRAAVRVAAQPSAILDFVRKTIGGRAASSSKPAKSPEARAVERLLSSIEGTERGLVTSKQQKEEILAAAAALAELGAGSATTDADTLSATWRLLWTTEKETLFILEKAGLFGTAAGEVYQVIDVEEGYLQNVITFPPEGAFVVDSRIDIAGPQRTEFKFTSATLKLPAGRALKLPPFGKGWFDTVYADANIRVAQDSRGDTLVVTRDGPAQRFS